MDYYKINITALPPEEWLFDVLSALLAETGFESFAHSDPGFEAYIPAYLYDENTVTNILKEYSDKFSFNVEQTFIKDQNWNKQWEDNYFKPVVIADECLIRGPLHKDYPHCRFEIVIEPGMSFGTGCHETTAMMIQSLLKNNLKGRSVLDIGCGTGVLSILASMMGASSVTAIDIDERAVKSALENSALNNIKNIKVLKGDVSVINNTGFDVILANLFKNILINNMKAFSKILNNNGSLYISGFLMQDTPSLKNEAKKWGLEEIDMLVKNNWVTQIFKKKS
jgi:ribosomal protein L11 methyltransferase